MKPIVTSDVLFFKSIRVLLLSIIIFMLATGNTFPIVAHYVEVKRIKAAYAEKHAREKGNLSDAGRDARAPSVMNDGVVDSTSWTTTNELAARSTLAAVPSLRSGTGIDATTMQVELGEGWNLFSLPLVPSDNALLSVLAPIEGLYSAVWAYNALTKSWERYVVDGPPFLNNLTIIEPGRGYWIYMLVAATLTITGEDMTDTAVQLWQGWNLVGFNSLQAMLLADALSSIAGKYYSVWTYSNQIGGWLRFVIGGPDFLNNLLQLETWGGYWIDMAEDRIWQLIPIPDLIRPEVDVTVAPSAANVGESVTITVGASDNVGVVSRSLTVNGVDVPLDTSGQATYSSDVAGVFTAVGTALDQEGNEGLDSEEFRFLSPGDVTPPTVDITSPADDSEISTPTDIIGTASDDNLTLYKLEYSAKDRNEFITFASGTSSVTGVSSIANGVLGRLDPTALRNGLYDVRLTAEDASGNTASITRTYQLAGEMKVGNFTMSFTDMTIPVAGIPITITRTYDSRNRTKGDFGVCWTLDISDLELSESGVMGADWQQTKSSGFFPTYFLQETKPHYVTVTYPDGRTDEFNMVVTPSSQVLLPIQFTTASFSAKSGTFSSLLPLANNTDLWVNPSGVGPVELLDFSTFSVYNPDRYQLTAEDGTVYTISQNPGLESIREPNGNTITFTPDGIIHSAGKSVTFTRDTQGRITTITDPMGNTIRYEYDFYGDLVSVTDREGNTTRFTFNSSHGLLDIIDPRGVKGIRNEYDDEGRLIAHIDADGNRVEYTHNVGTRQEVVKDRLGNVTVCEYDENGNVVQVTDALGNTIQRTFDAQGNKLSETDPLGNTTAYTYDAQGNKLTETDPLGNTTTRTYDSRGQMLTLEDPSGNVTTRGYNANGNLISKTDPLGNTTTYEHNTAGNITKTTDPLGNVTEFSYDAVGNMISQTDPLGNVTTYSYDSNGNRLSETKTRATPSGISTTAATITTTYVYDRDNRPVQIIDPYGHTTLIEYNAIGKPSANTDRNGNRTEYEYDDRGNLITATYPDGTTETSTYDAEGRQTSFTDRAGRTTQYVYDAMGRKTQTIYPDGSSTGTTYDAVGRIASKTDENGNTTTYTYDAAGRCTSVTDPLGNTTTYTYDANGNRLSMTDANGNTFSYEYDDSNQLTKTIFPDGTFTTTQYDPLGRKIAETDQAGLTAQFEYDAAGRLTKVIDALGNETTYIYDEDGNKLSQTDANGHITKWEYDSLNRVVKHTLPLGMSETFTYNPNGNVLTRTDFNGETTTYTYDVNDRLIKKAYPDSTEVSFTYTATGQRKTVTDARGVTSYSYDSRDRLVSVTDPDGTVVNYTYDQAGNRTLVSVPSGDTSYTCDALNRLATVTDPDGGVTTYTYDNVGNRASVTYPNGTVTEYTYDNLNRLTYLENRKSTGGIISSYTYTLGSAGNRTRVEEDTGRIVNYTYDNLYRLTREDISDLALGDEVISYTYDNFANRLSKTDSSGVTNYTYDENDRLLTETAPTFTNTYTYDNNGNTISKSDGTTVTSYAYDYENRLVDAQTGASQTQYVYDADGIRVQSVTNGAVTNYLVDKNRDYAQVLEETNGSGSLVVSYIYGDDLIRQERGLSVSYYHYDGQGSTRLLTDNTEAVTDNYIYDAFGILLHRDGTTVNNYLYTGEQYDPNIGFYYLRARYYNQDIGRFITVDPFAGSIYDPMSLHKYLYSHANPVMNIDPSGQFTLTGMMITVAIVGILMTIVGRIVTGSWIAGIKIGLFSAAATALLFASAALGRLPLAIFMGIVQGALQCLVDGVNSQSNAHWLESFSKGFMSGAASVVGSLSGIPPQYVAGITSFVTEVIDAFTTGNLDLKKRIANILVATISGWAGGHIASTVLDDVASDIAGVLVGLNVSLWYDFAREFIGVFEGI